MDRAAAHLQALDPEQSGDLLGPGEADAYTGMPAFSWMERAVAEAAVAGSRDSTPSAEQVARARALDPALGARMDARRRLHGRLVGAPLLAASSVYAELVRGGKDATFRVTYDRITPDALWTRIRVEVAGASRLPLTPRADTTVEVDPGFRHLLSRHLTTPAGALVEHLEEALSVSVPRLSRSTLGPFWFPGVALPEGVPPELGSGLLLHQSAEVVAVDVRGSVRADPLARPAESAPAGRGLHRERRFAASASVQEATRAWAAGRGAKVVVRRLSRP